MFTQHDSEDPSELEGDKGPDVKGQEEVVKQEVKVESSLEAAKALDEEGNKARAGHKNLLSTKQFLLSKNKLPARHHSVTIAATGTRSFQVAEQTFLLKVF